MTEFDSLSGAINNRTPVDFSYPKPGKITGNRIGNPHAIYRFTSKDGKSSTKVHIWQTGGVNDVGDPPLPSWRIFNFDSIRWVVLRESEKPFEVAEGYNPDFYDQLNHLSIVQI